MSLLLEIFGSERRSSAVGVFFVGIPLGIRLSPCSPAGSALFYIGMCAGFFLPLATYAPALALIQGLTPNRMRSTVTGFTVLLINVFAIALGDATVGAVSDRLTAAGSPAPLTTVLVATDLLALVSAALFALAARGPTLQARAVPMSVH